MRSSHSIATYSSTSRFLGSATKRHAQKNVPRHTHRSSSDVISVSAIGPFREQSSSARDRRNSVSSASFSGRTTRTPSSLRRQTERTSRIESKNNDEEKDERTRDDESKTSKEKEVEKSFDKALSKKLTTMAIPSKERKQNILLRTLTAVAITCAAILPQISERPPTPAMSIGTARTSTLVVGATKSVLDDAGLKKEKDRKRSSWYAGTINL